MLFTGKYKTTEIDCAAALLMHGIEPIKIQGINNIHAEFTFKNSTTVREITEAFYRGEIQANINLYMQCRQRLKIQAKKTLPKKNRYANWIGKHYYYIDAGTAVHSTFGRDKKHYDRAKNDNVFFTKEEALASIGK